MSNPHQTCSSKNRYPSKKDARTAMNAAMRRHSNRPERLRAYYCPACQGWHLTSKEFEPAL